MRFLFRWASISCAILAGTVIAAFVTLLIYARVRYGTTYGPSGFSSNFYNPRGISPSEWAGNYLLMISYAGLLGLIALAVAVLFWAVVLARARGLK